ncbi:MAG: pyrroline-5-carboxylate reductase [Gammaproteobacteria bacterium]
MADPRIAFIGGGNMARSLIGGLLASGWRQDQITVADPDSKQLEGVRRDFRDIKTAAGNREAAANQNIVLLAVKPQVMRAAATELNGIAAGTLVMSIAAGVRSPDIEHWLGGAAPVVRCMPNTPALVRRGATALFSTPKVSAHQRQLAEEIMRAVGITVWVEEENLLDPVTALSGSGPAYFLLLMEVMEQTGKRMGLPEEAARRLTLQTALGAAELASQSDDSAATLRARVTSKGGTTERAIDHLIGAGFIRDFARAIELAADRARELADGLSAH